MHAHTFFYTILGYTIILLAVACSMFADGRLHSSHHPQQASATHQQQASNMDFLSEITLPKTGE